MTPKLVSPRLESGTKKFGWLKALKSSKRNWKRMVSVKFHDFCTPMSQFTKPGARRFDRNLAESPKVNAAGCENAAGLIQSLMFWFCGTGLTPGTMFGRWLNPNPPGLFCAGLVAEGKPGGAVGVPLHCQPPRTAFIGLFQS